MDWNDRTGETKLMKNGFKATIIAYRSCADLDVQFEDGTIVAHRTYYGFKQREIGYPGLHTASRLNKQIALEQGKKIIGETRMMSCGIKATVIAYRNAKDIDIQFEDGYIAKGKTLVCFKRGIVFNPNQVRSKRRIGETKMMNCGMKATIIKYESSINIDVEFEDGYIVKKRTYKGFKRGEINNPYIIPNSQIGKTNLMHCGMKATIIAYKNCKDITVQFEDGYIAKNKTIFAFNDCEIVNPNLDYNYNNANNKERRIGETKRMANGLIATIVQYQTKENIDIQFEDGTVTKNKRYAEFKEGHIAHSTLVARGSSSFCGFECKIVAITKNGSYYKVKHPDGFEGIMTPQDMMAYNNC